MRLIALALAVLGLTVSPLSQTKSSKGEGNDIVFMNGDVYTGTGDRAQAFLVRDGRIAKLGSNDSIRKAAGPNAI